MTQILISLVSELQIFVLNGISSALRHIGLIDKCLVLCRDAAREVDCRRAIIVSVRRLSLWHAGIAYRLQPSWCDR